MTFLPLCPPVSAACELYAFCGALFGICSMITLTVIAVDRYFVITRPLTSIGVLSRKRALLILMAAWAYSLGWSLPPFFGWSEDTDQCLYRPFSLCAAVLSQRWRRRGCSLVPLTSITAFPAQRDIKLSPSLSLSLTRQVPMSRRAWWLPVRGTTWRLPRQCELTLCCSSSSSSSCRSSSSSTATSSSSAPSVPPTSGWFAFFKGAVWFKRIYLLDLISPQILIVCFREMNN